MTKSLVLLGALGVFFFAAPQSKADGMLVGQCIEFTACWSSGSPTSWSDSLSGADLASIVSDAGSTTVPFIVEQNTEYVIRLGITTMDFTTTGGPVMQSLGEFNGSGTYSDPCPVSLPYCETDTVGDFTVPGNALSATISGTFGNSTVPNSAGECLYLGATGPCSTSGVATPEPTSVLLVATMLLGLAFVARKRIVRG
jgi:hypothetical protein